MTFVNTLMTFLQGLVGFIGDAFTKLFEFLSVPLGWIVALIEGIFYFLKVLVDIVIAILDVFWSLFSFIGALFIGFFKTIKGLLWIDYSQTPVHYPSGTGAGIGVVIDKILQPVGFLTVVPTLILAVIWLLFIIRVFALIGGNVSQDD